MGIAAPDKNIIGKAITIPITWAVRAVGARLVIKKPNAKKDKVDRVKPAKTLK